MCDKSQVISCNGSEFQARHSPCCSQPLTLNLGKSEPFGWSFDWTHAEFSRWSQKDKQVKVQRSKVKVKALKWNHSI